MTRVIFAALPPTVRAVLIDTDTLVVADDLRMYALPYLPILVAAALAGLDVGGATLPN